MPSLNADDFENSLEVLFDPNNDPENINDLAEAGVAFQNLAMYYIEKRVPFVLQDVRFDVMKMSQMLTRFYRDAFGRERFNRELDNLSRSGKIDEPCKKQIEKALTNLGVRINSERPKKTRIVAAFSLWMATFRPIYLDHYPVDQRQFFEHFDASVNFFIATAYLRLFGTVKVGDAQRNPDDSRERLKRIWYDFTVRDLNLSCLEFMYAFIFVPHKAEH